MRALLVVNHNATTTSGRIRDVLVQALHSVTNLDVAYTQRRGHAASLARQAAADNFDVVVALGGDGTVNEVVNGLLADGVNPDGTALAVVPGGSTNVFARSVGFPKDRVEATGVLLEAIRERRHRTIGLGRADDRYFTFSAGMGFDAEIIRRVEQARHQGGQATPALYFRTIAGQFLPGVKRGGPRLILEEPGGPAHPELATIFIQNTKPWTYLGERPIEACPDASFDLGLDIMAVRSLRAPGAVRTMSQLLLPSRRHPHGPHGAQVLTRHDLPEFTIRAEEPIAFQLDGDYLGERDKVGFVSVPAALRVIC
jgi:diacylglycerol kinase family enzyme